MSESVSERVPQRGRCPRGPRRDAPPAVRCPTPALHDLCRTYPHPPRLPYHPTHCLVQGERDSVCVRERVSERVNVIVWERVCESVRVCKSVSERVPQRGRCPRGPQRGASPAARYPTPTLHDPYRTTRLDHIPRYSRVYGHVHVEGLVTSCFSLTLSLLFLSPLSPSPES